LRIDVSELRGSFTPQQPVSRKATPETYDSLAYAYSVFDILPLWSLDIVRHWEWQEVAHRVQCMTRIMQSNETWVAIHMQMSMRIFRGRQAQAQRFLSLEEFLYLIRAFNYWFHIFIA
jgi:hypothetical protein